MKIDGHTRLAAVVAKPIKHSISPFIHNTALEKTAVNGVYLAWEIGAEDLEATVANIRRYNMFGINLSMPYKQEVIQYLDELAPSARLIGAVNTVVNKNDHFGCWRSRDSYYRSSCFGSSRGNLCLYTAVFL